MIYKIWINNKNCLLDGIGDWLKIVRICRGVYDWKINSNW